MALTSEVVRIVVQGNDSATDFSFSPMVIFGDNQVIVTLLENYDPDDGTSDSETELTLGSGTSNYAVNVATYPGTGSLTYPASGSGTLATGDALRIDRNTTAQQSAQLRNQGGMHPQTIELALDRLMALAQENKDRSGRAIKLSESSDEDIVAEVTVTEDHDGYVISYDHTTGRFEMIEASAQGPQGPAGPQGPQGASGAGSGDMLAAQNLADVSDPAEALENLGGQPADATLTALSGLTIAANKIIKGTGPDTVALIDFLDEDDFASDSASGLPSQQSVKAYIAAQLAALTSTPTGTVADYAFSTAPSGWLFLDGRTIGDASSSATSRANADTVNLFTGLWNSMADAQAPVSGGRGGSAAADFAAHKWITLPDARDRVIAGKGNMSGSAANRLTNQSGGVEGDTLGASGGAETHVLTTAQIPAHLHNFSVSNGTGTNARPAKGDAAGSSTKDTNTAGGGAAHNNVQPTLILNKIVKL
jgi:microcystin-dependent protein